MKKILLAFQIILFVTYPSLCQDFGGFSPGINWKQINTKSVRVIFPESLENQANRVANMVLYMDQNNHVTIGEQSKKIDLILNNQGVMPNGYVALSPYRSEFFTTPFQKSEALGSLPWLDLLSIHEYRHALQYANFRKGITKIGYILTGETFWSLALNLSTPNWYFEGDGSDCPFQRNHLSIFKSIEKKAESWKLGLILIHIFQPVMTISPGLNYRGISVLQALVIQI